MASAERLVEAVNLLIAAPNYARLINEITRILDEWACHPMTYAGHLSPLNAVIDLGTTNRASFERLIKLIEAKRKLVPETSRVDYQREYMAEKRARLSKALTLQELQKGKFTSAAARKQYSKDVQERWRTAREKFIADKGEISWADRNEAANEFWRGIDTHLDEAIAQERRRRRT